MRLRQTQRQNNRANCDKTVNDWLLGGLIVLCCVSLLRHKNPLYVSIAGFSVIATTIATKYGLNIGKKHPYKEAKLVHGKRAYIEFYAYCESSDALKRKRIFCPAKFKTVAMVERWANNYIPQLNTALEQGYHFKAVTMPGSEPGAVSQLPPISKSVTHPVLLTQVFKEILQDKKAQVRYRTFGTYKTVLAKFEAFLQSRGLTDIGLNEFTTAHAYEFRNYLTGHCSNTNKTTNNNLVAVKVFFEGAIEKGYIDKNPLTIKSLPETDSDQHEVFTVEHQRILEDYLKDKDFALWVFTRLLYCAFIRPNEIRGLRLQNIDLTKRTIDIPGKIAKNRRTETIPINQTLFSALLDYARTGQNINTNYLFGKRLKIDKLPMALNHAYNRHKLALKACGLTDYNYTLYSWKHTGASRAYEVTKDILRLSKLLRHASTKETENYLRSIGVRLKSEKLDFDW